MRRVRFIESRFQVCKKKLHSDELSVYGNHTAGNRLPLPAKFGLKPNFLILIIPLTTSNFKAIFLQQYLTAEHILCTLTLHIMSILNRLLSQFYE